MSEQQVTKVACLFDKRIVWRWFVLLKVTAGNLQGHKAPFSRFFFLPFFTCLLRKLHWRHYKQHLNRHSWRDRGRWEHCALRLAQTIAGLHPFKPEQSVDILHVLRKMRKISHNGRTSWPILGILNNNLALFLSKNVKRWGIFIKTMRHLSAKSKYILDRMF